jgi:hypothetical protein
MFFKRIVNLFTNFLQLFSFTESTNRLFKYDKPYIGSAKSVPIFMILSASSHNN